MWKHGIKKLLHTLFDVAIVLFGVTFLSFSLMHLAPGDPGATILRAGGAMPTEQDIIAKRAEMGLDRPFLEQYGSWLSDFVHGDLGVSMVDGKNVTPRIMNALKNSMLLAVVSLAAGIVVALPVGVLAAVKKDRAFDKLTCTLAFIRLAMPSFLVGLGLLYVFAYKLKLISVMSSTAGAAGIILPVVTLATGICARMVRQIRTTFSAELREPYVNGLRSKGVGELRILFRHVLKNTMLPIMTLIALSFGELIGGTAVVETIFSWPGLGRLALNAINERDYTIIQGFVVTTSLIFCLIYGLTELSYGFFDPRVKKAKGRTT